MEAEANTIKNRAIQAAERSREIIDTAISMSAANNGKRVMVTTRGNAVTYKVDPSERVVRRTLRRLAEKPVKAPEKAPEPIERVIASAILIPGIKVTLVQGEEGLSTNINGTKIGLDQKISKVIPRVK